MLVFAQPVKDIDRMVSHVPSSVGKGQNIIMKVKPGILEAKYVSPSPWAVTLFGKVNSIIK